MCIFKMVYWLKNALYLQLAKCHAMARNGIKRLDK